MSTVLADHSGPTMFFSGTVTKENVDRVFKAISGTIKDGQLSDPNNYCNLEKKYPKVDPASFCFICNGEKMQYYDFENLVESFNGRSKEGRKLPRPRINDITCQFNGNGGNFMSAKRAGKKYTVDYATYGGDLSGWLIDLKEKGIESAFYAERDGKVYRVFGGGKKGIDKSIEKCKELGAIDDKDLNMRLGKEDWNAAEKCIAGVVDHAIKKNVPGLTCQHIDAAAKAIENVVGDTVSSKSDIMAMKSEVLSSAAASLKAIEDRYYEMNCYKKRKWQCHL